MGKFDRQALHEALKRQIGTSTLSKVVSVNYDLTTNDTVSRVFKTAEDAQAWITANGGTLSASNRWTIKLASGTITEPLVKLPFIDFECSAGTTIDELVSAVEYTGVEDYYNAGIKNAIINTVIVPSGMCLALVNCYIKSITVEDDTCNVNIYGGIVGDIDLGNCESDVNYTTISGKISKYNSTNFNKCVFTDSDGIEVESGDILNIADCLIPKIINSGGIINTYNNVFDSDLTASESTKGCIRYTEGSGYSRYQMVMQTGPTVMQPGATTWEWVTIKENTW